MGKYPKHVKKLWICYQCNRFNTDTTYNTDFDKNGLRTGSFIPPFKDEKYLYMYLITDIRRNGSGSDLALWDNGLEYDLKYHHKEKISAAVGGK